MATAPQHILVVGATGYIGRFVCARLAADGHTVRAVVRDRRRAELPGAHGAPSLRGAVNDWVESASPDALGPEIMHGVDAVVSTLGVTRQKADPWQVDFRMNLAYLQRAEQAAVNSFLYVGVMHAAQGSSMLARAKFAFMQVLRRSPLTTQILNPSGYFSDLTSVYDMARRGVAVGLGRGATRLSPIHGADLAEVCADRLLSGGGVWDVGGPQVLSYRQVVDLAFAAAGTTPRYLALPVSIGPAATWVADRCGPRASSLTRFFLEGLQTDSTAPPHGTRTLGDYFASLAGDRQRPLLARLQ